MPNDTQPTRGTGVPSSEPNVLRRLWQVPIFVAGVVAVIAVVLVRPPRTRPARPSTESDLRAARAALRQTPPDDRAAARLAEMVLSRSNVPQRSAAEAQYLLGVVCCHQAQAAEAKAAPSLWQKAREHLEQAEALGMPEADKEDFTYKLARATFQTGAKPERLIQLLSQALPGGVEERADALEMLTDACLKLPTPDLEGAVAANEKLLGLPIDGATRLAPARLRRAELLVRLDRRADARVALSTITPEAPHEIVVRARRLRAELSMRDQLWADARKQWEEALQDTLNDPAERARTLFNIGLCCARSGASRDALVSWQEAARSDGEIGQAAALLFGQLAIHQGQTNAGCTALENALRGIAEPGNFRNPLVGLEEARQIYEEACQSLRQSGELERSRQLALAYAAIAPASRAQELLAAALDALAEQCHEKARLLSDKIEAQRQEQSARDYFGQAGAACDAAADLVKGQPAELDLRWRAAQYLVRSQDLPRAAAALTRFLGLKLPDDRCAEGWYVLGTVYETSSSDAEAIKAFHRCIEVVHGAPFSYRARYQLAELDIKQGRLEDAETILRQNLDLMGLNPDPDAHEKTLLKLAALLYRHGNYRVAAVHLQQALDRYPANPRSLTARHVLADCYRRLADQEKPTYKAVSRPVNEPDSKPPDQYRLWLNLAATNYQKLREDLCAAEVKAPLSATETAILREIDFAELDCRFNLGQYETVTRLCEGLIERYRDQAESMVAYRRMLSCYWTLGLTESDKPKKNQLAQKARAAIDAARTRLDQLKDVAFANDDFTHDRGWWQQWLEWAKQQPWDEPAPAAH
jgi:tetratricopeptide (TPR) repeat protein